jgi:hypothetical protein
MGERFFNFNFSIELNSTAQQRERKNKAGIQTAHPLFAALRCFLPCFVQT